MAPQWGHEFDLLGSRDVIGKKRERKKTGKGKRKGKGKEKGKEKGK